MSIGRSEITPISQTQALDVARLVARANGFEWSDANVAISLDTALTQSACWRVTLWPDVSPITDFLDRPVDVVTLLPPDIVIDALSGSLVGLKPLREDIVRVENFGKRYRSA